MWRKRNGAIRGELQETRALELEPNPGGVGNPARALTVTSAG